MIKATVYIQSFFAESEYNPKGWSIYHVESNLCYEDRMKTEYSKPPEDWVFLGEKRVEIELPDFDENELLLKGLNSKLDKLMADYAKEKAQIQQRIDDLLALPAPVNEE